MVSFKYDEEAASVSSSSLSSGYMCKVLFSKPIQRRTNTIKTNLIHAHFSRKFWQLFAPVLVLKSGTFSSFTKNKCHPKKFS